MKIEDYLNTDENTEIIELPHGWYVVKWYPVLDRYRDDFITPTKQLFPTTCFIPKEGGTDMENVYLVIKQTIICYGDENGKDNDYMDLSEGIVLKIFKNFNDAKKYTRKITNDFLDDLDDANIHDLVYQREESYIIEIVDNDNGDNLVSKYFVEKRKLET